MSTRRDPTVTVVMIFLDARAYIAEAIDSVLSQTYRDFELVLVDDGSTDGSSDIARGYAARFPNLVRYTEHDGHRNLGMSASRNHGVALGRGRFVSFLDADDIWLPERLHRFVTEMNLFPEAGMLYGPSLYWYSWAAPPVSGPGLEPNEDAASVLGLPTHTVLEPPRVLWTWLASGGGYLPGICSLLIRREAYEKIGGFEASFRGLYEDQVFISKVALAYPLVVIPDVLDYYRQHPDSCCQRGVESGDYHPDTLHPARSRYLFWLEGYCREQGVTDRELLRALRREVWPYRSRTNAFLYQASQRANDALRRYATPWMHPRLRALAVRIRRSVTHELPALAERGLSWPTGRRRAA